MKSMPVCLYITVSVFCKMCDSLFSISLFELLFSISKKLFIKKFIDEVIFQESNGDGRAILLAQALLHRGLRSGNFEKYMRVSMVIMSGYQQDNRSTEYGKVIDVSR